ncbi:MAG: serine hydrolase [Saprospiraceae bacterium]|nr:serine hydrolase [Saprospiraceae bacterium]
MQIANRHIARIFLSLLLVWFFTGLDLKAQLKEVNHDWVQEKLALMSLEEKIGQLFMIRAYGKNDSAHIQRVIHLISNYHVGGLCFFQGDPVTQAQLTNLYQSTAKIPLLISMDAEWGLGMRLKQDGFHFPKQMTMGALSNNQLIYKMGREQAIHLSRLGVHLNFAPVLDINNNPNNPVINERSFGDDKLKVSQKSYSFMKGLQDGGVLACAKHFPGHGDTDIDSHFDLPILKHDKERLDSFELFPFKVLGQTELASVMIAHLAIPALDPSQDKPASLSRSVIQKLLRREMAYDGLVITDALEMKAVSKKYPAGQLELEALKAGNDILLLSENIEAAVDVIKKAIEEDELKLSDLNGTVYRILMAKTKAGLHHPGEIKLDEIVRELNTPQAHHIRDQIYREAITLVKDEYKKVPIRKLPKKSTVISFGTKSGNAFHNRLRNYFTADEYFLDYRDSFDSKLRESVEQSNLVILTLHRLNYKAGQKYGLSDLAIQQIGEIAKKKQIIAIVFGTPYAIQFLKDLPSILLTYEDNPQVQDIAAQILMGTDPISGILPVAISNEFPNGTGILRPSLLRLGYSLPESVGMNSVALAQIDSICYKMIEDRATPGAQILIAKDHKIIYQKSFGTTDFLMDHGVDNNQLYDIASLTKIFGAAPALMHLIDRYQLDVTKMLAEIYSPARGTDKEMIPLKDILLHQSGLQSWIPFYKHTLIAPDTLNLLDPLYYRRNADDVFSIEVAKNTFLHRGILDTIFARILSSKLSETKKYQYSDLWFYTLPDLFEKWTGESYEDWLENGFFASLGLTSTMYNPLKKGIRETQIAPSEDDHYFRQQVLLGYVHDMGAAMLGGVSGHAGLFSHSRDLAVMMQCYLNLGQYGGEEYFQSNTIRMFTWRDPQWNRRSLCFDLKTIGGTDPPYVSNFASENTFGHQGFTGTCAWADPKHDLIYIFLSNRTYPNSSINLLHRKRYRTKIQDIIYQSMIAS